MVVGTQADGIAMKKLTIIAAAILLVVLGGLVGVQQWHRSVVSTAEEAVANNEFGKARIHLEQQASLAILPSDHWRLRYLLAVAYLSDPELDPSIAGDKALPLLESIPADSEYYAEAQVNLAKHWFLLFAMPKRGEQMCRNALQAEPDNLEAKDLLFSIYTATNDPVNADKIFWQAFPQSPQDQKASRFQQWYCSQFTRNAANQNLDDILRVVDTKGEIFTIFNRLVLFKNQEPDEGQHFAALADWWLSQDETKTAIEVLAKGREVAKNITNSYYLGSFSDAMLRQGELELTAATLDSWPQEQRNFKYWRNLGVLRQNQTSVTEQNRELFEQAVEAYNTSTKFWPSGVDPNLYHRISVCQKELGNEKESIAAEERAARIRLWMEEKWSSVSRGMSNLDEPEAVQLLIQFYTAVERPEAVTYLQEHLKTLEK